MGTHNTVAGRRDRPRRKLYGWALGLWAVIFVVSGCASDNGRVNGLNADSEVSRGVIVGTFTPRRVVGILGSLDGFGGHTLEIRSVAGGKIFVVPGAGYFQLSLEPGAYELLRIRLDGKDLIPLSEPFRFLVTGGEVSYVGSIVTERDISSGTTAVGKTYLLVPSRRNAELRRDRAPQRVRPEEVVLYVVNAQSAVEELFRERNPERAGVRLVFRPAK